MDDIAKSNNHEQKTEGDGGNACIEEGWGEWVESRGILNACGRA